MIYTKKLLLIFFLLLGSLTGCQSEETKSLIAFYEEDLEDITKISILDGSTGYSKTVTDKLLIDDFLNEINSIQFIPEENQELGYGFIYSIALYDDNEKAFIFTLNVVDDHIYDTEPDIYPIVDRFYKNI